MIVLGTLHNAAILGRRHVHKCWSVEFLKMEHLCCKCKRLFGLSLDAIFQMVRGEKCALTPKKVVKVMGKLVTPSQPKRLLLTKGMLISQICKNRRQVLFKYRDNPT